MILVFGGAYNGKLDFVKNRFNISDEDIFDINNELELDFNKKVIRNFQKLTYNMSLHNNDVKEYLEKNIDLLQDKIIISDDISEGIVPLKKEDRIWREANGKALQYLALNSKSVYRVFCGIPMVIKNE